MPALLRKVMLAGLAMIASLSIAAFIRSSWRTDEILFDINQNDIKCWRYSLVSDRGRVGISMGRLEVVPEFAPVNLIKAKPTRRFRMVHVARDPPCDLDFWEAIWFSGERGKFEIQHVRYDLRTIMVPVWMVCALCTGPFAPMVLRWHRARRRAAMRKCGHCGYDLRATPYLCPECGRRPGSRWAPPDAPINWTSVACAARWLASRRSHTRRRLR
jgi:hypothetical protein